MTALRDFESDLERAIADLEDEIADIVDVDDDLEDEIIVEGDDGVRRLDVEELRDLLSRLREAPKRRLTPSKILAGNSAKRCALSSRPSSVRRRRHDHSMSRLQRRSVRPLETAAGDHLHRAPSTNRRSSILLP
jgi:hypothetical protein